MRRVIECNGQTVTCYGSLSENSTVVCGFDLDGFDGTYADDVTDTTTWEDLVQKLTSHAEQRGIKLTTLAAF